MRGRRGHVFFTLLVLWRTFAQHLRNVQMDLNLVTQTVLYMKPLQLLFLRSVFRFILLPWCATRDIYLVVYSYKPFPHHGCCHVTAGGAQIWLMAIKYWYHGCWIVNRICFTCVFTCRLPAERKRLLSLKASPADRPPPCELLGPTPHWLCWIWESQSPNRYYIREVKQEILWNHV